MEVFLSIDEVRNLLDVSDRAVRKQISAGKYTTQQVPAKGGKGGLKYEIALTSLPQTAQQRYHERLFNQEVEKIYAQEQSRSINATLSKTQREVARENSQTSQQTHGTSSDITHGYDESVGQRSEVLSKTSNKVGSQNNGGSQTARVDIGGITGGKRLAKSGLSGAGQSGTLAVDKIGGDANAVSSRAITSQNTVGNGVDLFAYTENQRKNNLAIKVIFAFIDQFGGSEAAALRYLNSHYLTGSLPKNLMTALDNCHQKKKATSAPLLRRTLANWRKRNAETGSYVPQIRQPDMRIKPWHRMAIALYGRPQKPTFTYVEEKLAEHFSPAPTYRQIVSFFNEKYSQSDLNKGRHTGLALTEKGFHHKRTHTGMQPWDEMQADGWATHFTAPHPVTKTYQTFEVWDFHDVATRYVPPFAIGASECFEVIAKGIELAIREGGVMAILQTDSTKIVKNNAKFSGNPLLSISDRAGLTIVHPIRVGNAPANGISENFHAQLDRWSRELATYQARGTAHDKGMDSLTLRRMQKLTAALVKAESTGEQQKVDECRREIAKVGKGILFESYQEAVDWLEAKRVKFNNTPHSALDKVRDDVTGKMRHQTPQECLDAFKADGWTPYTLEEAEIVDLFRPRVMQKVRAHVVKPYHKDVRFYHRDLAHYEGKDVVVSYDIMDYTQVWVYDLQGSLIVVAPHCADVMYRSLTAAEASKAKRDLAKVKRLELKIDGIQAESVGVLDYIEGEVVPMQRVSFAEEEPIAAVAQFSRTEMLSKLWGEVKNEDEDDFNQQQER